MLSLVTADLHLSPNPRDSYRFDFLEKILPELLQQRRCNRLLILGDLTHEKDNHGYAFVNRVINGLANLQKLVEELYVLNGNHDGYDPYLPFFHFSEHLKKVYWLVEPSEYVLQGLGRCQFLPHTRDHAKAWRHGWRNDLDWVFAHNTFDGADAGGGRRLRGIDPKVLPRHVPVISGDVHVPQEFGNITYVGAPYTVNFGDGYEPRVLMVALDPHKRPQTQSISVVGVQKRLIELPADLTEAKMNKIAKGLFVGDIVKCKVHLSAEQYSNWQKVHDTIRAWLEEGGCVVHSIVPVKASKTLKVRARKSITRYANDPEIVRAFAKRNNTPKDVLKTGLWLMEQV